MQTIDVKEQHSPFFGSAQFDKGSQQMVPQMFCGAQQAPLWQTLPEAQQVPLQLVWPGWQQMPLVQTSPASQQSLPQGLCPVEQPQVPSGEQLVTSVPQHTLLHTAAGAGQQRLPPLEPALPWKVKHLSFFPQVVKKPHGVGRQPPPGRLHAIMQPAQ